MENITQPCLNNGPIENALSQQPATSAQIEGGASQEVNLYIFSYSFFFTCFIFQIRYVGEKKSDKRQGVFTGEIGVKKARYGDDHIELEKWNIQSKLIIQIMKDPAAGGLDIYAKFRKTNENGDNLKWCVWPITKENFTGVGELFIQLGKRYPDVAPQPQCEAIVQNE